MKTFNCQCGQQLFFENTHCSVCQRCTGFDYLTERLYSLNATSDSSLWETETRHLYRLCKNYTDHNVCNWIIDAGIPDKFCLSCRLNTTVPNLSSSPDKRQWWSRMETAKRRLLYSLLSMNLQVRPRTDYPIDGLSFAFLEDKRSNPDVFEDFVATGHCRGLITVNLSEADDVNREWQRVLLGESYRTLLGHFRHESGHFYFEQLVASDTSKLQSFRTLFGDETIDYKEALQEHYQQSESDQGEAENQFISDYAKTHPLEDWAECWAHYLHMMDTLETAVSYGLINAGILHHSLNEKVRAWVKLSLTLNALNRSMGLSDAYPFVLSSTVVEKLQFIERVISGKSSSL